MSVVDFRPLPLSRPLVLPAVDSLMSPAGRGGFRRTTAGLPSSSYTADKPAEHREAEASTHGHTASEEARIRIQTSVPCSGPETQRLTEPEAWADCCHLAPSRGLECHGLMADLKGTVEAVLSRSVHPFRAPWLSSRVWAQPGACALGSVRLSRDRPRAGALGGLKARRFQTSVWPPGSLYLPSRRPQGPARWPCPPACPCLLHFPPQAGLAQP